MLKKVKRMTIPVKSYLGDVKEGDVSETQDVQRYFCSNNSFINGIAVTLLTEDYLPPIILGEIPVGDELAQQYIVDGIQRTGALMKIRYGNYKFTSAVEDSVIEYQTKCKDENGVIMKDDEGNILYAKHEFDIKGKTFDQLPQELKQRFDRYQIEIVTHQNCTMRDISKLVRRYNNHTAMKTNQKALTWIPTYARKIKTIASGDFFKNAIKCSDTDRKSGNYETIVERSVMSIFHMDNFKKDAKAMSQYLEENMTIKELDEIASYLDRMAAACGDTCKEVFVRKDINCWVATFAEFAKYGLPDSEFTRYVQAIKTELHDKVVGESSYDSLDAMNGTTGKPVVQAKIALYIALMKEFLHIEDVKKENNTVEDISENVNVIENQDAAAETEQNKASNDREDTVLDFVRKELGSDKTEDDVEFYKDLVEDTVRVGSTLYNLGLAALITICAYACDKDKDREFEQWAAAREKAVMPVEKTDEENYTYLKNDFDKFLAA